MKIYLDDERQAPDGWTVARNFTEFTALLDSGESIEAMSLDHDLGEESKDGYEAIKWAAEHHPELFAQDIPIDSHSSNPNGNENIRTYVDFCRRNIGLLLEQERPRS